MLGGMGRLVWSRVVPNNAISASKIADFSVHLFRLAWPGMQLVFIILLYLLFRASLSSQGF